MKKSGKQVPISEDMEALHAKHISRINKKQKSLLENLEQETVLYINFQKQTVARIELLIENMQFYILKRSEVLELQNPELRDINKVIQTLESLIEDIENALENVKKQFQSGKAPMSRLEHAVELLQEKVLIKDDYLMRRKFIFSTDEEIRDANEKIRQYKTRLTALSATLSSEIDKKETKPILYKKPER